MAETKDFINKLMKKEDSELDDLLSFAENVAENVKSSNNKPQKTADEILDELETKYQTIKLVCHEIKNPGFTQPVVINFHHLLSPAPLQDYISYESLCGTATKSEAILEDKNTQSKENTLPLKTEEIKEPQEDSLPPPTTNEPFDAFEFTDTETPVSNAEKFITEQGVKHPRIYFMIGISIFFLTLLGLASCIYLGVTALRNFAENYSDTSTTPSTHIFKNLNKI